MQSNLNQTYQIISNWGIIKNIRQYNDTCQVMYVNDDVGDGYFESYDFGLLNLARLNCQFKNKYTLTNTQSRSGYWIYIILQGKYQMYSVHSNEPHNLLAPSILLLKGELDELTASIPRNILIQSFYIEFGNDYFIKLQQQLQHNPSYQDSILHHFFHQDEPYCYIPLTDNSLNSQYLRTKGFNHSSQMISNPFTEKIMEDSWQLYRTPMPKDEMSLMSLQGATYSFISELLMQSYSKLYQFNLKANQHIGAIQNKDTKDLVNGLSKHIPIMPSKKANHDKHALYAIQAKLLIDQFYYENWTIRQLAKRVHTNECYLKRDFKCLTGMTIASYRNQVRMQRALHLLSKDLKTIEIANQLGFNSHDYFLKSFKKFYNCLPMDYLTS